MLIVISPAKTLDFETSSPISTATQPDFLPQSQQLIDTLTPYSPDQVSSLMKISDKLAELNVNRYHDWHTPFNSSNAKQASFAFKGDVYTGLDAPSLNEADLLWAQDHLRILSGLYGALRPLDFMQAYRLEMGTKLKNSGGKDLYAFWGDTITDALNQQLEQLGSSLFVNLASQEYFKAVKHKNLNADMITPDFKDWKNGKYKIISFYAKKARGLMTRWIIENRITEAEKLKKFSVAGYRYSDAESINGKLIFTREEQI